MNKNAAAPVIIPPTRKVTEITRLRFTPISFAFSSDIETARIAIPIRVLFTKRSSKINIMTAATRTMTVSMRKFAPAISPKLVFSRRRGFDCGLASVRMLAASDSAIDIPIAEIKLASLLLPRARNLRYARSSTITAVKPEAAIAISIAKPRVRIKFIPFSGSESKVCPVSPVSAKTTANVPTIKISEFAKLIRRSTP